MIITSSVYNYTEAYDFIWNELPVLITFESDWRLAETIMHEIAMQDFEPKRDQIQERLKRVRRKYLLRYNIITPYVYVSIVDSGIRLTLRSLVRARLRRGIQDTLSRKILERFSLEGSIDFAYPTMRLYRRGEEQTGLCATIGKESEGHESPNR